MNTTQAIEMYKRIERQGNALLSAYQQIAPDLS